MGRLIHQPRELFGERLVEDKPEINYCSNKEGDLYECSIAKFIIDFKDGKQSYYETGTLTSWVNKGKSRKRVGSTFWVFKRGEVKYRCSTHHLQP